MIDYSKSMELVKYTTETHLVSQSTINDVLKLNNKELLLVSLLERLCQTIDNENKLFRTICQYLNKIGILENQKLYSDKKKFIRKMYSDYLIKLIGKCNENTIDKLAINNSLYAMNFIELERLGTGGFGRVYKVYNKIDTQMYAVKIIPFVNVDESNNIRAFNEVRCISKLCHENIARYYTCWLELSDETNRIIDDTDDIGDVDTNISIYPVLYIQMELCVGSLREFLLKRNYSGIKSNMKIEKQIIYGITNGMKYLHENEILHRDLNPNNIFLDAQMTPKIGDFGLAVKLDKTETTDLHMSSSLGVCLYMPPEYEKDNIYTKKSDVYSMGIIFFEILNHFSTDMERYKIITDLKSGQYQITAHDSLENWITQMVNHDPQYRPHFKNIVFG